MRVTARISPVLVVLLIATACGSAPPCGPITPHDAGACGQTFNIDYDPSTQTGCVFNAGAGTADTCAGLCGAAASCELITFTSVQCSTTCP
jgi:hypothetical protein